MATPEQVAVSIRITGMTTPGCAGRVERALRAQSGVESAGASFLAGEAVVRFAPGAVEPAELAATLEALGYGASIGEGPEPGGAARLAVDATRALSRCRLAWPLVFPVALLLAARAWTSWVPPSGGWLELLLAFPVLIVSGRDTLARGRAGMRAGAADGDALVAFAILTAYASGVLHPMGVNVPGLAGAGAVMLALHETGRYRTLRARRRIGTREVGTLDAESAAIVSRAQMSMPRLDAFAGTMAGVLVPVAAGAALVAALAWLLLPEMMQALGGRAAHWLPWTPEIPPSRFGFAVYSAVAVVAIAAPAALALAAPAAVLVATAVAARRGQRVREGAAFEHLRKMSILCIEKSGVLTRGEPGIIEIEAMPGVDARDVLTWSAAVALFSNHPLDRAIVARATRDHCDVLPASEFVATPGGGVRALVDGAIVMAGKPRYLAAEGVDIRPLEHACYRMQREAKTVMAVSRGGRAVGLLASVDPLRPESVRAIKILNRMNLQCVLLTGDSEATAKVVADQAGIKRVVAEIPPGEKAKAIARLKTETIGAVGVLNCGAGGAAARVAADVAIAFGCDTAAENEDADALLAEKDFMALVALIQLGRATCNTIVQNLWWAFGYNSLAIALAMLGLIHPVVAVAAANVGVLIVFGNALRIRRFDPEKATREVMRR